MKRAEGWLIVLRAERFRVRAMIRYCSFVPNREISYGPRPFEGPVLTPPILVLAEEASLIDRDECFLHKAELVRDTLQSLCTHTSV